MTGSEKTRALRLVVDPMACDGVGICAHLAPDVITPDRWGYPVVVALDVSERERQARAAATACPRRALHIVAR